MSDILQKLLEGPPLEATAFAPNSRYHGIGTLQIDGPDGTPIVYLKRRFIAQPDQFSVIAVHNVVEGDRIDNLAAAFLGDPELYWRICDANVAMTPEELTETVGAQILITLPEGIPGGGR